jgi:hypothetical protein
VTGSSTIEVRPVRRRAERRRFVRFQWRIYRDDPCWVPPLEVERMAFLDRRRNAFFRHSEAELFLAWRDGEPVGRIAAIENRRHLETYDDSTGFFGFFETIDDPQWRALVDGGGLGARARTRLRGDEPASTTSAACWSTPSPPPVLFGLQPAYEGLLEAAGSQDRTSCLDGQRDRVPGGGGGSRRRERSIRVRALDFSRSTRRSSSCTASTRRPGRRTGARCR